MDGTNRAAPNLAHTISNGTLMGTGSQYKNLINNFSGRYMRAHTHTHSHKNCTNGG